MKSVRLALLSVAILPFAAAGATPGRSAPAAAAEKGDASDLTSLRAKAERGNAIAQYNLGLAHLQGRQTPVNLLEAFAWLTLAGEGGATGRALDTVLDALTPEQLAAGRKRLETLRAGNPHLRTKAVVAATKPAPPAVPIIRETVTSARPAPPSTPIIAIPPAEPAAGDTKRLHDQLASVEQEKRELAAELGSAWKEIEEIKGRLATRASTAADLTALQVQLRDARAELGKQSTDLATVRAEAAAARIQQASLQSQLTAAREAAAMQGTAAAQANDALADLERERAAHATTQSAVAELKNQVAVLTTARAALERDATERVSSVERALAAATDDAKKRSVESAEHSRKGESLAAELSAARTELGSARQALATIEEKNSAALNELAQTKSALIAAGSRAASAAARAEMLAQNEAQLPNLRSQAETLQRELQEAKTASNRSTADKATAETALASANQKLADAAKELTSLRQRSADGSRQASAASEQKIAALQSELTDTKSRLAAAERIAGQRETEIAKFRSSAAAVEARPAVSAGDVDAARRSATEAQQKLAAAERELSSLRQQASVARELETRVRQLEAEKTALAVPSAGSNANAGDLARARSAQADAEGKLSTALRSYALVARERDELQARVAELSGKFSSTSEALTTAEAQAKAAVESMSASVAATAELETLRNRAAAAERSAETARAELARANQLLAALRPSHVEPTRPTAPAGEPARTHTIAPGETLSSISLRYYGTASRWNEILAANRDVLVDERSFAAGRTLRIP